MLFAGLCLLANWGQPIKLLVGSFQFIEGFAGSPVYVGQFNDGKISAAELFADNKLGRSVPMGTYDEEVGIGSDGSLVIRHTRGSYDAIKASAYEDSESFSTPGLKRIVLRGRFQLALMEDTFYLYGNGRNPLKADRSNESIRVGISGTDGKLAVLRMDKHENYTLLTYSPAADFSVLSKALVLPKDLHFLTLQDPLETLNSEEVVTVAESYSGRTDLREPHIRDIVSINSRTGRVKVIATFQVPGFDPQGESRALPSYECHCIVRSENEILVIEEDGVYQILKR